MSTFSGLNTAASGLQANQTALNVTGHNIANANNPNYKRQDAVMTAKTPHSYLGEGSSAGRGQIGTGVEITSIRQLQDQFTQSQILDTNSELGGWQTKQNALDQVVGIINEPSDSGLNNDLDKFWNGMQELSLHPDDMAARNNLVEFGNALGSNLNNLYSRIESVRDQQDSAIGGQVDQVNDLAKQLASLNGEIASAQGSGVAPNDLLDQRDGVLNQLSTITGIQVHGDGGAGDTVSIGGHVLVQGSQTSELSVGTDSSGHAKVQWKEDGSDATVQGGSLGGAMTLSHDTIPGYLNALDDVAKGLISGVNTLHQGGKGLDGTTGKDFFSGTGARDLHVNEELASNPRKIAASASGAPGDGSIALAMAKVKNQPVQDGLTVGEVYSNLVSKSGTDASTAANQVGVQTNVSSQLSVQRQSVSGVSLDEEMANMVKFQQSYNANARLFTAMDEMLSTLIDRMGTVGR